MNREELIRNLLLDVNKLMSKKPFTRGGDEWSNSDSGRKVNVNGLYVVDTPNVYENEIKQEDFLKELNPYCHKVLFDENIPSIHQKLSNGSTMEIKTKRTAINFQEIIKDKQTMHLAAHKMSFTLLNTNPDETQQNNFITFKQYWELRNQDGMKYKMVDTQKSVGDVGLLYYFNYKVS